MLDTISIVKPKAVRVAFGTQFTVYTDPEFAKAFGRVGRPIVHVNGDYVMVTLQPDDKGVGGSAHGVDEWRFTWSPGKLIDGAGMIPHRPADAEIVTATREMLSFRVRRSALRPVIVRDRNRAAVTASAPTPAAHLSLKELVQELNQRLRQEDGLQFAIGPEGQLKATIMVEFE